MAELETSTRLDVLEFAHSIGSQPTFAAFIDTALAELGRLVDAQLVTFNRMDMSRGGATVITRPFRSELVVAADDVGRMLREHPIFMWAPQQLVWPVVRLSDVATRQQLQNSPLYRDVLLPVGAAYSVFIFVSSAQSNQWVYFVANRPDRDFADDAVEVAAMLQPVLVAALARWSEAQATPPVVRLTTRERAVLGFLATGLTAEAMARALQSQSATVRKHLQNTYRKLDVQDRLGAVIRARELGILNEEDFTAEFVQKIQVPMPTVALFPTNAPSDGKP